MHSGGPPKVPSYTKPTGKYNFLTWPTLQTNSKKPWEEENKVVFRPKTAGIRTSRPKYTNPINCPGNDPPEIVEIVGQSIKRYVKPYLGMYE